MCEITFQDDQWRKVFGFLRGIDGIYIGNQAECRRFIEAIIWMARSGAQWRLLPKEYGSWNSVFKRFNAWGKKNIWEDIFSHFSIEADMTNVMIDSSIVRANSCAAGYEKSGEGIDDQALGRSRGGFSTKIHVLVDTFGRPIKAIFTGGQVSDVTQALPLLEGIECQAALMDKAYDANDILDHLAMNGIKVVIPPKANRKVQREYDKELYKERNLVERFFGKIKQYRRVFSRFDKTDKNFSNFFYFSSLLIWLR